MAKESIIGWSRTDRAEITHDSHGDCVPAIRRTEREGEERITGSECDLGETRSRVF